MRKLFISLLCAGLFFMFNIGVFSETGTGSLRISLIGFNNNNGKAMLSVYNTKETYNKSAGYVRGVMEDIKGNKAEVILKDLAFGTYAVKVFHDENGNGLLDTGAFGIPKEQYGFSNNARNTFGPAKWEDAQFKFNKAEMTIEITVK